VKVWCLIFLKQTPGEAEDSSQCLLKIQQWREFEQNSSEEHSVSPDRNVAILRVLLLICRSVCLNGYCFTTCFSKVPF